MVLYCAKVFGKHFNKKTEVRTLKNLNAKKLCRAGVIAALYAGVTFAFSSLSYGPVQVRPAEALTILPLFFIESIPALFVGCLIANLLSPFGIMDIAVGSTVTLIAAILTYLLRKRPWLGFIPPIALNAAVLPLVWLVAAGDGAFWWNLFSIAITQTIFITGLGIPLYLCVKKLKSRGGVFSE